MLKEPNWLPDMHACMLHNRLLKKSVEFGARALARLFVLAIQGRSRLTHQAAPAEIAGIIVISERNSKRITQLESTN